MKRIPLLVLVIGSAVRAQGGQGQRDDPTPAPSMLPTPSSVSQCGSTVCSSGDCCRSNSMTCVPCTSDSEDSEDSGVAVDGGTSADSAGLSDGAIAGIIAFAAFVAILVLASIAILLHRRKSESANGGVGVGGDLDDIPTVYALPMAQASDASAPENAYAPAEEGPIPIAVKA